MVRVLKQSRVSSLIIQAALLSTELEQIFTNVTATNDASVLAKAEVRAVFGETSQQQEEKEDDGKRKPISDDDDCGVCFEALKDAREAELDWCKDGCGKSIHKECWNMWRRQVKFKRKRYHRVRNNDEKITVMEIHLSIVLDFKA